MPFVDPHTQCQNISHGQPLVHFLVLSMKKSVTIRRLLTELEKEEVTEI